MKRVKSVLALMSVLAFGVLVPAQSAYAIDAMQILINISNQINPIQRLVTAGAYILGLGFAFKGIYSLKVYGQSVSMMSSQTTLKTPLMYLFVGAMLIYLPTAMNIMMQTTFGTTSILSYTGAGSSYYGQGLRAVLRLVQLIGVISFVRGWVILAQASGQGGHQGASFGKAMTHIIGGVLAVNIILFLRVMGKTTGIAVGI